METQLRLAFQSGEVWAFNEVYSRLLKPILRFVQSKVRREDIAQELTQEIFLKAFRFSSTYQSGLALTSWIWSIAWNTIRDFRRSHGQGRLNSDEVTPDDLESPLPSAERLLEVKVLRRKLLQMARKLSAPQRRALWLRLARQLSYEEIAENMGLTLGAVKSLLHRSQLALARMT